MEPGDKKMKSTLRLLILFVVALLPLSVLAQGWQWAKNATKMRPYPATNSASHAWPIATDRAGNVYVAMGSSFDTLIIGGFTHHCELFTTQVILTKYSPAGDVIWSVSSTDGSAMPIDIAIDQNDNVILYGYFTGDYVRFGTHSINRSATAGYNTGYLVKFNDDGVLQWGVNSGTINIGLEKQKYGGVATDKSGNIYAACTYYGPTRVGSISLTNNGSDDIYVARYSPTGSFVWAKSFGGDGYDRISDIAITNDNAIYIVGDFSSNSLTLGAHTLTYSASGYSLGFECYNVFVAKMNSDGEVAWARQTTGNTRAMCVATDGDGSVYVGGVIRNDTVSFGGHTLLGNNNNPYLLKYTANGNFERIWPFTQTVHAVNPNHAIWDVTVDLCGNVWVAGGMDTVAGNGIFLDTTIVLPLPQAPVDPLFIAGYTSSGHLLDYKRINSGGRSNSGIVTDAIGNIYLCGYYDGAAVLYVGSDTLQGLSGAYNIAFTAKYAPGIECAASVSGAGNTGAGVLIFPNPADGMLTITGHKKATHVHVTDITGKTVVSQYITAGTGTIATDKLLPGIYLIRLDDTVGRKFIKN